MIRFPSDWIQHRGVQLATALPPASGMRFRYYERVRPQPTFATILSRVLANDPDFLVHEVGEMERIVTHEGEYGAHIVLDGLREGRLARRTVGAVFLQDFAAVLEGIGIISEQFAKLESLSLQLLRAAEFGLARRPRHFYYEAPRGWQAVASGPVATWYPSDFPNNLSTISALPAVEHTTGLERAIEDALAEAAAGLDGTSPARSSLVSALGITGELIQLHGTRGGATIHRDFAVFVVGQRVYRFRLETTGTAQLDELRALFRAVVMTFRPLPDPDEARIGTAFVKKTTAFDHWGD